MGEKKARSAEELLEEIQQNMFETCKKRMEEKN